MPSHKSSKQQALPDLDRKRALARTVQEFPERPISFILQLALTADEAPPWWSPARDRYLDKFWPTEPFLAGAIYSVSSRNASFRWELTGPRDQVRWAQQLLCQADFGDGWQPFMMKTAQDLLTTGNGAFIELIRPAKTRLNGKSYDAIRAPHPDSGEYIWYAYDRDTGEMLSQYDYDLKVYDSPLSLPVGIAHLDSARAERTGDPDYPVIYTDLKGGQHKLGFHQVLTLAEMPSPRDEWKGVQVSAVDRVLKLAQILRDLSTYKSEKVSGRFARAIHLTNIDAQTIQDAVDQANESADAKGLLRYMQPIVAATLDPNARPDVATLELASLPSGFEEETTMRWYIAGLATVLGVDYGFLAPLPGSKLGTAAQAETQERQARGKSSRLFMRMLAHKFNYSGVLPRSVVFKFAQTDPYEESERDRAFARRTRARSTAIQSGEITPEIARQLAADVGDLDPKYLAMMGEGDVSPIVTVDGETMLMEPGELLPRHLVPGLPTQPEQPRRPQPGQPGEPGEREE